MAIPPPFRLFGVLFVAVAAFYVLKPAAMLDWMVRTYRGEDRAVDPTTTRLLATRVFGAVVLAVGLGIVFDSLPG